MLKVVVILRPEPMWATYVRIISLGIPSAYILMVISYVLYNTKPPILQRVVLWKRHLFCAPKLYK